MSSNFDFMKRAEQESARHGGGRSIWSAIWDLRKQLPEFAVRRPAQGQQMGPTSASTTVLLLNDGWGSLCHTLISSWSRKGSYPVRENVRCLTWAMNDQAQWVRTRQKDCPICIALGKAPTYIAFYLLWNYAPYMVNNQWIQGGRMEVLPAWREAVRATIMQSIEAQAPVWQMPVSAARAYFDVYRSPQKNASRIGDMWIFKGFHKAPDIDPLLKSLPDLNKFYPVVDDATAVRMLSVHKNVADTHRLEEPQYSVEGMASIGLPTTQQQQMFQPPAQQGWGPPPPPQQQPGYGPPAPGYGPPAPGYPGAPGAMPPAQGSFPGALPMQSAPPPQVGYPTSSGVSAGPMPPTQGAFGFSQPMGQPMQQPTAPAPQPPSAHQPAAPQPPTAPVPPVAAAPQPPTAPVPPAAPMPPAPAWTAPPPPPVVQAAAPTQAPAGFVGAPAQVPPPNPAPGPAPQGTGPSLEDLDNFDDVTPGEDDPDYPSPDDPKV